MRPLPHAMDSLRSLRTPQPLRFLRSLNVAADPVVAVRDTRGAAESALEILARAGFPARMLTVVGRQCPRREPLGTTRAAWRSSGAFWGMSLSALMAAAALALPVSALAPTSLLLVACLALALQACIVANAVAPEPAGGARWQSNSAACRGHEAAIAADKLLLVVDGSRSEIALARSLLQSTAL